MAASRAAVRSSVATLLMAAMVATGPVLDSAAVAQAPTTPGSEPSRLIAKLGDSKWQSRRDAFYRLLHLGGAAPDARVDQAAASTLGRFPDRANEIRAALTKALEAESAFVKRSPSLTEDYTDYYGDLITVVVSLKDPRSVKALVAALGTGNMVIDALAAFGQAAADPVIELLGREPDPTVKQSACAVLRSLLEPTNPGRVTDPAARKRIEEALARASAAGRTCARRAASSATEDRLRCPGRDRMTRAPVGRIADTTTTRARTG
jgi:hypothetical protein